MKKIFAVLLALIVVCSFSACGEKISSGVGEGASAGGPQAGAPLSDAVPPVSETDPAGETAAETAVAPRIPENEVYVGLFEQDSLGALLPAEEADKVCEMLTRYKMDQFSWDNISDYTLVVNGVYYSYDSSGGIITKDDTHADTLSESDRKELNGIIGVKVERCGNDETLASDADTVTDTFVVERAAGTHLELRKAGGGDNSLYACDYGRLDGSGEMEFKAGDTVVVRYDREVMETWPVQMTVREIYPAEWN